VIAKENGLVPALKCKAWEMEQAVEQEKNRKGRRNEARPCPLPCCGVQSRLLLDSHSEQLIFYFPTFPEHLVTGDRELWIPDMRASARNTSINMAVSLPGAPCVCEPAEVQF